MRVTPPPYRDHPFALDLPQPRPESPESSFEDALVAALLLLVGLAGMGIGLAFGSPVELSLGALIVFGIAWAFLTRSRT